MSVARRQRMEVGDAVGIAADELGVDDARRQAKQGFANDGEARGYVFAVTAQDCGAAGLPVELRAPAVVLHLVQPLRPRGRGALEDGG